jgi:hypothetical protein
MAYNLTGMRESEVREWLVANRTHIDAGLAVMFLNRTGPFKDIDLSTDDREQIFPSPEPSEDMQTHKKLHGERYDA